MPDAIADRSIVRPRLALCSYLLMLGLLSTVPYPRQLQQFISGVGGLLAVLLLGFRYSHYRTLATGIDEYRSAAPYLRPGATLAALTYGNVTHMPNGKTYDSYINPFPHAAGYLSVERRLFNFKNYEAQTGYFPLIWRPGTALLTDNQGIPAVFDLAAYLLLTGLRTAVRAHHPDRAHGQRPGSGSLIGTGVLARLSFAYGTTGALRTRFLTCRFGRKATCYAINWPNEMNIITSQGSPQPS